MKPLGRSREWPAWRAQRALVEYLSERNIDDPSSMGWSAFEELADIVDRRMSEGVEMHRFRYEHPADLQPLAGPEASAYQVPLTYSACGAPESPLVVCLGGVANTARRFDVLAQALSDRYRVVALNWAGRGTSGWLREVSDYGLDSCVAQARALLERLGGVATAVIGSSLGAAAAIRLASGGAKVERLVLNDTGPVIPASRRRRRARVIGRHYVFSTPASLFRRLGAAQKNDGPVEDAVLLHGCYHQTRWSSEEEGRVYRHDLRALLAYRAEAENDLDVREEWDRIAVPVLTFHGVESDNLLRSIWEPMSRRKNVWMRHVPQTGHTPTMSDRILVAALREWLEVDVGRLPREATLPVVAPCPRVLFLPSRR